MCLFESGDFQSRVWRAFLDGGLADKLNLLLFLVGLPLAIAAIAKARGPSGRVLGAAATFAGLAILLVGTLGWYTGRARTNGAVSGASVNPGMRDRIRREGYMESNCAIDFGLGFAAIPLVLGGIAVVISRRRERHGVGLPELTLGVAGLIVVTDVGALTLPLPGRDLPTGDPDWHVVDAYYMIDMPRARRALRADRVGTLMQLARRRTPSRGRGDVLRRGADSPGPHEGARHRRAEAPRRVPRTCRGACSTLTGCSRFRAQLARAHAEARRATSRLGLLTPRLGVRRQGSACDVKARRAHVKARRAHVKARRAHVKARRATSRLGVPTSRLGVPTSRLGVLTPPPGVETRPAVDGKKMKNVVNGIRTRAIKRQEGQTLRRTAGAAPAPSRNPAKSSRPRKTRKSRENIFGLQRIPGQEGQTPRQRVAAALPVRSPRS